MEFASPIKIIFGAGAMDNIAVELSQVGAHKPLIITTTGSEDTAPVRALLNAFGETGVTVGIFAGIGTQTERSVIKEASKIHSQHGFDSLIALGGGTVVNTTKLINIAVSGTPDDLHSALGENKISKPLNPLFVVAGLVGDGFECSKYALLDGNTYASPFLFPDALVIDEKAIDDEFSQDAAASATIALARALDSFGAADSSYFSRAYAGTLVGLLLSSLNKISKNEKWKLPFANAVALSGCILSNNNSGLAHSLALALSQTGNFSYAQGIGAIINAVIAGTIAKHSTEIYTLLMPLVGVDEPAAVNVALKHAGEKLAQASGAQTLRELGFNEEALVDIAKTAGNVNFSLEDSLLLLRQAYGCTEG